MSTTIQRCLKQAYANNPEKFKKASKLHVSYAKNAKRLKKSKITA